MKIRYFVILGFLIIFASTIVAVIEEVQYPVKELGNCESEKDCRAYCDEPENIEDCLSFARKNRLMSEEEVEMAEKFLQAEDKPGGCESDEECQVYCGSIDHIDECIAFAEENNLIPPEELEEAKKVQAAVRRGVKPPPCGNKKQCDIYCEEPDHMEECIAFGLEAGFIEGKELEDAQKMLQAIKRGVKPPPCKGKSACDEYCSSPDNMEICMNFALEAGFMSEQEKADSEKMLQAIKKGVKPPPCKGKKECDVYCAQEEHFEECTNFALAAGFISEEDLKKMSPPQGSGEAGMTAPESRAGPGGCRTPDECQTYCEDNPEECQKFQPGPGETNPAGQMMPPQAGPGGCKGPEECSAFCEDNPEQCGNFQSSEEGQIQKQGTQQQFQLPPLFEEGPIQQMPPPDQNIAPPSPQPTSFLINPDSLVASAVRALFNFLFNR